MAKQAKNIDASATATTVKKHSNLKPFQPGVSGNPAGRRKGARNKLGEAFLEDMLVAWETNGKDAIERVIKDRPHEFIKAVAGILPKELSVTTSSVQELSDDELTAALIALRSTLAVANAGNGSEKASRH